LQRAEASVFVRITSTCRFNSKSLNAKGLNMYLIFIAQFITGLTKTLTSDSKIIPNVNNVSTTSNDVENPSYFKHSPT